MKTKRKVMISDHFNIQFEKYTTQWLPEIYKMWSDSFSDYWILGHHKFNSDVAFESYLQQQLCGYIYDFRIMSKKREDKPIFCGFIYTYDFRLNDGHCKISVCPDKQDDIGDILKLYIQMLFQEYPLHKVFCDVCFDNQKLIKECERIGFKKEAHLINYQYFNNSYHDVIIFGVERQMIC